MNKEQKNKISPKNNSVKSPNKNKSKEDSNSKNKKTKVPYIGLPDIIDNGEMKQKMQFFKTKRKAVRFFQLSQFIGQAFSKDPKNKVGCVILSSKSLQILSTGYNGIPRGIKEFADRWTTPEKKNWVTHAIPNAIYNATRSGVSLDDCIVITSLMPDNNSARAIIQIGAKMLLATMPDVYDTAWKDKHKETLLMFKEGNITVYFASYYYGTGYRITKIM